MKNISNIIWSSFEKVFICILHFIFKMLHKELNDSFISSFLQFIRFGIVGMSNTFISYFLYSISLVIFQSMGILKNFDYLVAQVIQFMLSVLWSFYWNNKYVFKLESGKHRILWQALVKTYISYSFTGLFLSSVLLMVWVRFLHISEFIAPIINLVICVPINFLINKFWAFKQKN